MGSLTKCLLVVAACVGWSSLASATIIRTECGGGSGRNWCEDDFFGVCETGTARMDLWVDETGYYDLKSELYTNDSGDHQRNEAFYILVRNSRNPEGYPRDPNCGRYRVILDGIQNRVDELGTFYLVEGEANHVELVHYCILYNRGECTQYFDPGGEGGGGCRNCESVGFNLSGLTENSNVNEQPCWEETVGDVEWCDGVDNDCDGQIDEDYDGDGYAACEDCDPTDPDIGGGQPEVCDGLDNNCNGEVDEGLLNACGGCEGLDETLGGSCGECGTYVCDGVDALRCQELEVNACGGCFDTPGTPGDSCGVCGTFVCSEDDHVVCYDPGANACGACGETAEVCDGQDNDCDGVVDEVQSVEVCNCLDDDCNGLVDDGALCDTGFCHDCRCTTTCNEGNCIQPGTTCVEGVCVAVPCPNTPCPLGQSCLDGACVDPCVDVVCPQGTSCQDGECGDPSCHALGCPDGLICSNGNCITDGCVDMQCTGTTFCREGKCVESCAGVECPGGSSCLDGECIEDSCAGVRCSGQTVCFDGQCVVDPCDEIDCPGTLVCLAGVCRGDPCERILCPGGQICSGDGQCDNPPSKAKQAKGSGCGCQSLTLHSKGSLLFALLGMGIAGLRRRRR